MLILLEVRKNFPAAFSRLQVFVDGGFERGSDILKAVALGATAVGIARPFLYALVYGQAGVERLSQSKFASLRLFPPFSFWLADRTVVLKDELETSMRLAGITSLDQATPALVNTLDVDHMVPSEDAGSCPVVPRASKL